MSIGLARAWTRLGPGLLPFADAATAELPLPRLLPSPPLDLPLLGSLALALRPASL